MERRFMSIEPVQLPTLLIKEDSETNYTTNRVRRTYMKYVK